MKIKSSLSLSICFLSALLSSAFTWSQENDFDYYLPPHETQWVIHPEQEQQRYLLLHQANQQSYLRGLILHVPNWSLHPYQSPLIRQLYLAMPEYGWESYALQAPTHDILAEAWQVDDSSRYPAPLSDEELAVFSQPLQERMQQTLRHLEPNPGFRVVVAEGVVAAFLIRLYAHELLPAPDALVVIAPYFPQWQLNQALPAQLAALSFPVLDLQPSDAHQNSLATAAERVIQARRLQHTGYRQRLLPAQVHLSQPHLLKHQVYGWLSYEDF